MTENQRINELLRAFNKTARIPVTFGMKLSFNDAGQAVVDLPYNPGLDHSLGGVHGGVYMTLLDTAAWFTSAASHEGSIWVATSELTVHLLKPVIGQDLRAVGEMVQSGSRQDIAQANLYTTRDGAIDQLVGHGVGTFVVLPHLGVTEEKGQ